MTRLAVLLGLAIGVAAIPASAARLPILASQDLWPVFAPDGRHVAFTRVNGQGRVFTLEVVDTQTGRTIPIGENQGQLSPSWSSDGRIAYTSGGKLYVAKADGTGKTRYAAPQKASSPAWRPHSAELAYLTTHDAGNLDLWVAGTLWAKGAIGQPAWSPDGSKLAFQRDGAVWVASAPLTVTRVAVTSVQPGSPVWSPDGTRIAYSDGASIYVLDAATGKATKVADGGQPEWRDDHTLIYSR